MLFYLFEVFLCVCVFVCKCGKESIDAIDRNLQEWSNLSTMTYGQEIIFVIEFYDIDSVDRHDFFHWKILYRTQNSHIHRPRKH